MYSITLHHILLHVLNMKAYWCNFLQPCLTSSLLVPNTFQLLYIYFPLLGREIRFYTQKNTKEK